MPGLKAATRSKMYPMLCFSHFLSHVLRAWGRTFVMHDKHGVGGTPCFVRHLEGKNPI